MRPPLDQLLAPPPPAPLGEADLAVILKAFGAKRFDLAAGLAQAALQRGASEAVLHDVVAFHLRRIGDFDGAIAAFKRALALDPDNVKLRLNLAACLLKVASAEHARAMFVEVLDREPDNVEGRYGLGVSLNRLDRLDDGHVELARAVELDPNHAPAIGALAQATLREGDRDRARALAERALALQPGQMEAELAMAKIEAAERRWSDLHVRITTLLGRDDLGPDNRASALILLGDALDGQGVHAAAFEAYREGKAGQRELFAPQYEAPGRRSARDIAEDSMRSYLAAPPPPTRPCDPLPNKIETQAFLIGFARSGTTLLENVLAAHPDVECLDETDTISGLQAVYIEPADGFARLSGLDDARWIEERSAYWSRATSFGAKLDRRVFVDKLPMATLKIGLIAGLFPEAKLLFALRDPRDVVLSCFRRNFMINPPMYEFVDLERAARFYDTTMRAGDLFRQRSQIATHMVRYESFVTDFESEAGAACRFLGVDWSDQMTRFADQARVRRIKTPSASQVARGLYTDGIGQWRRYADQLRPVFPILQPWIEQFGYPPD